MPYLVKEMFYTLQGEGLHAGRAAVFCRFSGCNLWTGRAEDRPQAVCPFCDTDFLGTDGPGGGRFETAAELADAIEALFIAERGPRVKPFVVFTGGEPALQLDAEAVAEMKSRGFETAVETNGTVALPEGLDWIAVSPKAGTELNVTSGSELKLVWPQENVSPEDYEDLDFEYFLLQPRDSEDREAATLEAVRYCLARPQWRLSLQTHKYIGIP